MQEFKEFHEFFFHHFLTEMDGQADEPQIFVPGDFKLTLEDFGGKVQEASKDVDFESVFVNLSGIDPSLRLS
jgi:hypothetical protein